MTAAIADDWALPEGTSSDRGRLPRGLSLVASSDSTPMSLEEYLEREKLAERKHEYVGGRAHAMAGASKTHVSIVQALVALLLPAARRRGCRVLSVDMKLQIDDVPGRDDDDLPACYYPDLLVTCARDDEPREYIIKEPSLIMEVLSPSTAPKDRGIKWQHYQLLPSLQQYWMVSQDRRSIDVYTDEAMRGNSGRTGPRLTRSRYHAWTCRLRSARSTRTCPRPGKPAAAVGEVEALDPGGHRPLQPQPSTLRR